MKIGGEEVKYPIDAFKYDLHCIQENRAGLSALPKDCISSEGPNESVWSKDVMTYVQCKKHNWGTSEQKRTLTSMMPRSSDIARS